VHKRKGIAVKRRKSHSRKA